MTYKLYQLYQNLDQPLQWTIESPPTVLHNRHMKPQPQILPELLKLKETHLRLICLTSTDFPLKFQLDLHRPANILRTVVRLTLRFECNQSPIKPENIDKNMFTKRGSVVYIEFFFNEMCSTSFMYFGKLVLTIVNAHI